MIKLFNPAPQVGKTVEFTDRNGVKATGVVEFSSLSYIGVAVQGEGDSVMRHQVTPAMFIGVKETVNG